MSQQVNISFEEHVKQWVHADNQLKALNERVKVLRMERNQAESEIFTFVAEKRLSNATVSISDGKLRFVTTTQTAPLTLKYVEECLKKSFRDPAQVVAVMQVIKESRETKVVPDIKRYYRA